MTRPRSAAVIGGGWAGCAAAACLAAAGVDVTLFEAAAELGGRGRRVPLELDGVTHTLDNGQHLMIGAYTAIANVLATVGVDIDRIVERRPFELSYPDGFRMRASRLPAPWHLVTALLRARGLPWRDRWAIARFLRSLKAARWQVGTDREAARWLEENGQSERVIARVWRPLGIAALNTPLAEASAQVFANVLRDSLGADSAASMLWLPRGDLSALLPEAVERFVSVRGGAVRRGVRVATVGPAGVGFRLDPGLGRFDAVVYAAPPGQLGRVAAAFAPELSDALDAVGDFAYQPICTVYLKYDLEYELNVALPRGFTALLDDAGQRNYGQWAFDRGALDRANAGVLAVVVSASGARDDEALPALCDAVARQLTRELGLPAPRAARAVVEKRATLAARPGLQRPQNATRVPGFVLAGDWTHSDYPSTLESAVRSGVTAAGHLLQ
ncbi:MAG TPA: hydroxysqualene dehydroxylase HpnE [Burkholderiaceae bacterium]|nr:hydroxysqualene dehydroxylase HpnE [Burkholderiaceae bacterium]